MLWDTFNEPRCPGCMSGADQRTHLAWNARMAEYMQQQVGTGCAVWTWATGLASWPICVAMNERRASRVHA